jgi:hypothetical protein
MRGTKFFFWGGWGNPREGRNFEGLDKNGRIMKWIFKKWDEETLTGLIWLGIGIGDGRLCMW